MSVNEFKFSILIRFKMNELFKCFVVLSTVLFLVFSCNFEEKDVRIVEDFNFDWTFKLGNHSDARKLLFQDSTWQKLNLPHDWQIENYFNETDSTHVKPIPQKIGWYRKTFTISEDWVDKSVTIEFDGVYRNSEVWINGRYLGKRPNGYVSFAYEVTDFLNFGDQENVIAVKVENPPQTQSSHHTGSGIYRNVKLIASAKLRVSQWGTHVSTQKVTKDKALVNYEVTVQNNSRLIKKFKLETKIYDAKGYEVGKAISLEKLFPKEILAKASIIEVLNPNLWRLNNPYMYRIVTRIYEDSNLIDNYTTPLGIRTFNFDRNKGFTLNGEPTKILGVCLQQQNGALGAVSNKYAFERKLNLLKDMGVNAIRTLNAPSSELLQLCDQMGFLVQNDVFDVWKIKKTQNDYSENWDKWHTKDLEDLIKRDRNHPSVIVWNIGDDVPEQFNKSGIDIVNELVNKVKSLDSSRFVTSILSPNQLVKNGIYKSNKLDFLSINKIIEDFQFTPEKFKGKNIIISKSTGALATRGYYGNVLDSLKNTTESNVLPTRVNKDFLIPAYDQQSAYHNTTHEDTWNIIKKLDFVSGVFVWSAFDYLGDVSLFEHPGRSSYSGLLDRADFPKDVYYMYQSQWTKTPVLHLFPHWNWTEGQEVDVWVYYNHADEVELFLNGESLGIKSKQNNDLHLCWQVKYQPGTLKAVSRKNGKVVLEKQIKTSGETSKLELIPNKEVVISNYYDLVYVTLNALDTNDNFVPNANNLIRFEVEGGGKIVGVDNGYQANTSSFKAKQVKAFNGKCLVIIQSNGKNKEIKLTASTNDDLIKTSIKIKTNED